MNYNPLILITGATCSGKSALAVKVAKAINAEIVSIDSVQVYKGFDIGSAKITQTEMQGVPHHLLDVWEADKHFDVAKYLSLADKTIKSIYEKGRNVVIVGGTTMYVTSLIHGLAPIKSSDEKLRERLESKDVKVLYKLLLRLDALSAQKLNANDKNRIIRALEVRILSKQSIKNIQKLHNYSTIKYSTIAYAVCQKREELYNNINIRTKDMVANGIIEETKKLLEKYDSTLPPFSSIGYKQVMQYLEKKLSKDEMLDDIAKCTRHLAKRQMTYLRNEPQKRGWQIFPIENDKNAVLLSSNRTTVVGHGVLKDFLVYNYNFDELIQDIQRKMKDNVNGVTLSYVSSRCLK